MGRNRTLAASRGHCRSHDEGQIAADAPAAIAHLEATLAARDRQLAVALAREQATETALRLIQRAGTDLHTTLQAILVEAARLCRASNVFINLREGDALRPWAAVGPLLAHLPLPRSWVSPLDPQWFDHRAVLERRTVHVPDMLADTERDATLGQNFARKFGFRSLLAVPFLGQSDAFGLLTAVRPEVEPFAEDDIRLLETFATQAAIAVEHARLFSALEERTRTLTQALEQQTATSDVLRTIAASPADLQRVLDEVVRSAARLTGAALAAIHLLEGDQLRAAASTSAVSAGATFSVASGTRRPLDPGHIASRVVMDGHTISVRDLESTAGNPFPASRAVGRSNGWRAMLDVPLLRQGIPVGVLAVAHVQPGGFTDQHTTLLETFADQAVIAIENARLFSELQESNQTLQEALEQQTALAEVLRVIATTPADLGAVLHAIAASAARLCDSYDAQIYRLEGNEWVVVASSGWRRARHAGPRRPAALRRSPKGFGAT